MQLKYDDVTHAAYVFLSRSKPARTERIGEHTLLDYDARGNVVGVELLYADEGVDLADARLPRRADLERLLVERGFRVLVQ